MTLKENQKMVTLRMSDELHRKLLAYVGREDHEHGRPKKGCLSVNQFCLDLLEKSLSEKVGE